MKKKKVKVFDAYSCREDMKYYSNLGISDYGIFDYHNQLVNKNGLVKSIRPVINKELNSIKPLEENIIEVDKYELDTDEAEVLKMLKHNIKQAEDLLDSAKRKLQKYNKTLLSKLNISEPLYDGNHHDCHLSPFNKCIYKFDEGGNEYVCVFCGEPEERK